MTGTSLGAAAAGGDTSNFSSEIAFSGEPVQEELTSPDAFPANSILSNGNLRVAMAAATFLICTPARCSLAVPRGGKLLAIDDNFDPSMQ